jgi:hypothetical protein
MQIDQAVSKAVPTFMLAAQHKLPVVICKHKMKTISPLTTALRLQRHLLLHQQVSQTQLPTPTPTPTLQPLTNKAGLEKPTLGLRLLVCFHSAQHYWLKFTFNLDIVNLFFLISSNLQ